MSGAVSMEELERLALGYKNKIEQVYEGVYHNESDLLTDILHNLIPRLGGDDVHLFCNRHFQPVAVFSLTLFSFQNHPEAVQWLQARLNAPLSRCRECVTQFVKGKSKMIQHFAVNRRIPHAKVGSFNELICMWRAQMVLPLLRDFDACKVSDAVILAMYEILLNPQMLRCSPELKYYYDLAFKGMYETGHELLDHTKEQGINLLVPGVVYSQMYGCPEQSSWATRLLRHFFENEYSITNENVTTELLDEITYHFIQLQLSRSNSSYLSMIGLFWSKMCPFFALMHVDVLKEYFIELKNIKSLRSTTNVHIESVFKVFYHHLIMQVRSKPLDILLRILKLFLEKLGPEFWDLVQPYTFHSAPDTLFNGDFTNCILRLQNNPICKEGPDTWLHPEGSISDLVMWTLPYYRSLSKAYKIQMVRKIAFGFLGVVNSSSFIHSVPKGLLMNAATLLLNQSLKIDEESRALLYSSDGNFETTIFTIADVRNPLNNEATLKTVVDTATNPDALYPGFPTASISNSAIEVLANCVNVDILNLCETTYKLYYGKVPNPKTTHEVKVSTLLITKLVSSLNLRMDATCNSKAAALLGSLRNVNGLLVLKDNGDKHSIQQNHMTQKYLELIIQLIGKCSEIPPRTMSSVLSMKGAIEGFWSCIFSPGQELYQEATNLLYETFDVEGRLEGFQELFNHNLTGNLQAICMVLNQLIKNEFYEPCPRAVRVLMDVINVFTDPVSGMFANYKTLKTAETDASLFAFWKDTWKFLDMIYRVTLRWATKYPYTELENFTKDTLEISNLLMNSYREFADIITRDSTNNDDDLFKCAMSPFKHMLYWLRLSDEDLLASCVNLIVSAADLSKEKNFTFDDSLVSEMACYASKSRKYLNKLTSQQSNLLLSRAKYFNEKLTETIIQDADKYHKEKEQAKKDSSPDVIVSSSHSVTQMAQPQQRVDYLQRKAVASSITGRPKVQSSITSFGVLKRGFVSAPSIPPKPLSKMELERRKLLADRVVHPPSQNVFNPRSKKQLKGHEDGDSSSENSDIDDANELFAIAKPKQRSTPVLLDINGKEVRPQKSKIDIKKQEEEFMRKRLNVDLNPFYDQVLRWDYTKKDEYPDDGTSEKYKDVADQFSSPEEYQAVMEPLLLLECWQGMCAARDREVHKAFSFIVGNRTVVSDFYEVYAAISKKVVQQADINEADMIVLGYFPDINPNKTLTNDDFKRAQHTCFAKVRGIKNAKGDNMDLTLRIHRSHKFANFLTLRTEIHAVKVMQMTTVEREYTSLKGLPFYDLVGQILTASPTDDIPLEQSEVEAVQRNYKLNTSQAKAVISSVKKLGFSLIQGPPGTGKTKTILGVVGFFLTTAKALPSNVIRNPTESNATSTEMLLQKQKVLICAPSNAAVDELVLRLREGLVDTDGKLFKPKLVRIGKSDAVNAAIRDLTLEELVDKRALNQSYEINHDPNLDQSFHDAVAERRKLRDMMNKEDGSPTSKLSTDEISKIQLKLRDLSKKINELGKQRDELRERNAVNYRNRELNKRKAQARILAESDIICSTLSGSAHDVLASLGVKFDTVIVDEACQCTELSSIIPLRYGGKRCIMVGDPNQLPPTVLSGAASNFKYNQSLFVRMEKNCKPHLLDVQYRMHSMISAFPSLEFYDGRLKNGPNMDQVNTRPWHESQPFGPYRFFDIITGKQQQNAKTMSYVNYDECQVSIEMIDKLLSQYEKKVDFSGKIGIISPYREQMQMMKRAFRSYFGGTIFKYIDFNTIDGFQGQEKEIIIISCVRADDSKGGVGFLKDFRRMNVALTRAKASLWILGHHKSLYKNKLWMHLISDAKGRDCLQMACPGFLDPRNRAAQDALHRFKNHHNYIENADDYGPEPVMTKSRGRNRSSRKRKHMEDNPDDNYDPVAEFKKENQRESNTGTGGYRADTSNHRLAPARNDSKKAKTCSNAAGISEATSEDGDRGQKGHGTKKKSSIFGNFMPPVDDATPAAHVYDPKERKPKNAASAKRLALGAEGGTKSARHISFSENVSFIDSKESSKD
ncbi:AER115Wp [Eremothecium gossypii ATCC 10895]|uniref:AER115Wp n=1 Tax=Eremothecium gossypii (strain ATCC 10895 / CBS 109.51 / FGSC 9923 / NRRL Y-1056) TaxID=284811 RepID=Q756Z8_EREGS|nr:AER115Wp [Eremothecium gossypii ATCC 10895]AAS52799.2 AER115Wp [Eremothecium gossypii ATCC 10895]AEY97105.1 FAER115Wp [Eremothecium gossypii FDAG1]